MPGVVDAVTAARLRLEKAEHLLDERVTFSANNPPDGRLGPAGDGEWRAAAEEAIHSPQAAINALQMALEDWGAPGPLTEAPAPAQ